MKRLTLIALAMCVALPRQADAQDRRLTTRLDAEAAAQVGRIVDSVRAAGLPAEQLIGVALEGASRRADSEGIVAAVRELAVALRTARQVLGAAAKDDEIMSAAAAVVAGVTPATIAEFRAARPSRSLTVPLVVLADLIARGVPADSAIGSLLHALRNDATDDALADARRKVERDILAGANPTTAVSLRMRGLSGRTFKPRLPRVPVRRPNPR